MEAGRISEMSVNIYETTRRNIPEGCLPSSYSPPWEPEFSHYLRTLSVVIFLYFCAEKVNWNIIMYNGSNQRFQVLNIHGNVNDKGRVHTEANNERYATYVAYRNTMHYNVKRSHWNDSDIAFKIIAQWEAIRVESNFPAISPSDT
jgi:hypothetical protein